MNGLVERLNRTLMTKARKMLFNANLNVRWWCEAVFMANIHHNISYTKSIDCTPCKKFYDQDFPLYNQLKVFGCTAICRIPKEKRKKLQPQGKKLIFMGFDKDWTYKLYDETTNTMKCNFF